MNFRRKPVPPIVPEVAAKLEAFHAPVPPVRPLLAQVEADLARKHNEIRLLETEAARLSGFVDFLERHPTSDSLIQYFLANKP